MKNIDWKLVLTVLNTIMSAVIMITVLVKL